MWSSIIVRKDKTWVDKSGKLNYVLLLNLIINVTFSVQSWRRNQPRTSYKTYESPKHTRTIHESINGDIQDWAHLFPRLIQTRSHWTFRTCETSPHRCFGYSFIGYILSSVTRGLTFSRRLQSKPLSTNCSSNSCMTNSGHSIFTYLCEHPFYTKLFEQSVFGL